MSCLDIAHDLISVTSEDLRDERGRAVRAEYAIADDTREFIIRLSAEEAHRPG